MDFYFNSFEPNLCLKLFELRSRLFFTLHLGQTQTSDFVE